MKAIALFSGGLDSTLAMKLIIDQGIDVLALNIYTGFGSTKDRLEHMQSMCDQVGAELKIIDIESEFLQDVLFNPKHGYGKNFNPCIDCHAKMFAVAKRIMEVEGASFLISGEVMGQRPMSQNKDALQTVLNESNCDGLLLRPMSAKMLTPTIAEEKGWVDRGRLFGFKGKSRRPQIELAKKLGIYFYPQPAGGCLLADSAFSKRLRDLMEYEPDFDLKDVKFLKIGRHFRLSSSAKLIVLRKKDEKDILKNLSLKEFVQFILDKELVSLGIGEFKEKDLELAVQITLSYLDAKMREIKIIDKDKEKRIITFPLPKENLSLYRIN